LPQLVEAFDRARARQPVLDAFELGLEAFWAARFDRLLLARTRLGLAVHLSNSADTIAWRRRIS